METKFFLAICVLLVGVSLVAGAEYHGSAEIENSGGSIIVGNQSTCEEDWSGFWTTCQDGNQTFACVETNGCGSEYLKPAQCGEVRECVVENNNNNNGGGGSGGGGGGSGGSSGIVTLSTNNSLDGGSSETCEEVWDCTDWSNVQDSCGVRTCEDLNSCGTEELKPLDVKECPDTSFWPISGLVSGVSDFIKASPGKSLLSIIILVVIIVGLMTLTSKTSKSIGKRIEESKPVSKG